MPSHCASINRLLFSWLLTLQIYICLSTRKAKQNEWGGFFLLNPIGAGWEKTLWLTAYLLYYGPLSHHLSFCSLHSQLTFALWLTWQMSLYSNWQVNWYLFDAVVDCVCKFLVSFSRQQDRICEFYYLLFPLINLLYWC